MIFHAAELIVYVFQVLGEMQEKILQLLFFFFHADAGGGDQIGNLLNDAAGFHHVKTFGNGLA